MFALKFQAGEISLYPLARVAAEDLAGLGVAPAGGAMARWRRRR